MLEIFKLISDYPNYEVSNLGNVRNRKTGRVLRPGRQKDGYLLVGLCKDGKEKKFLVHRLVATAFISNPDNKLQVNHINGNKTDNRVENLEWNTDSENQKHSIRTGLRTKFNFKTNNPKPKQPVRCIETGQEFESMLSASKYFGCFHSAIRNSIHKGYKCKGYHFELV